MKETKETIKKEVRQWINKLNKKQLLKVKDFLAYFSKIEVEFKPNRVFHVDAARSIVGKDGVKRWQVSFVENGNGLRKNHKVKSYDAGEFSSAIQAENFGICSVVGYLTKTEKWKNGKLLIYTDSKHSLISFYNDHLFQVYLNKGKDNIEMQKGQKFWLFLARKLAKENNIEIKLEWIKGRDNPADYYSRIQTE